MSDAEEPITEEIRRRAERQAGSRTQRWQRLGVNVAAGKDHPVEGVPRVSIVLATRRPGQIENCRRNVSAQNYPNLELIVVLNDDTFDKASVRERFADIETVEVLSLPAARNLGSCINLGAAHATGAYVAKMDDDDFYAPHYISDLMLAALESGADITGKKAAFYYFEEGEEYCLRCGDLRNRWLWPLTDDDGCNVVPQKFARNGSNVAGATLLFRREAIRFFPFDEAAPRGTDTIFQLACRRAGLTTYVSDEFNFCYMRRAGAEGHLWPLSKRGMLKNAVLLPSFDREGICV